MVWSDLVVKIDSLFPLGVGDIHSIYNTFKHNKVTLLVNIGQDYVCSDSNFTIDRWILVIIFIFYSVLSRVLDCF